jgi:hypothetical protein
MAPPRAPLQPKPLSRFGELFPEGQRKRAGVPEFLRQVQGDLPLVVDEVVPDVSHRDVVLGGGLFRNQQRSCFEQLRNVHGLIVDHMNVLPGSNVRPCA